jgi:hypothetical protein
VVQLKARMSEEAMTFKTSVEDTELLERYTEIARSKGETVDELTTEAVKRAASAKTRVGRVIRWRACSRPSRRCGSRLCLCRMIGVSHRTASVPLSFTPWSFIS